ncbi:MAG: Gfo/Idh/MocA family oxidoreductase [Rhodomicrobiaceae bacterium]
MLNAAVIGLGGWGQKLAQSVHGKSDKLQIACGVTRTVSKAAEFARSTGIPVTDDYETVLRDPAIDAVIIATPHSQHVEQVARTAAFCRPFRKSAASSARAGSACFSTSRRIFPGQAARDTRLVHGAPTPGKAHGAG